MRRWELWEIWWWSTWGAAWKRWRCSWATRLALPAAPPGWPPSLSRSPPTCLSFHFLAAYSPAKSQSKIDLPVAS